ncbi:DUF2378 family protein [Stigmatella sp. ncwal1]|uniref:DUF2378 family protein n=1 Tax=Stigmatella ashevillensis TaxID=2995309 RepID=A0ABT5DFK0_9BACT|nr:DUF2378 family protein [Stigmatella ashevillena]MDC0712281.1 DUF2378 family protein [Stigmatella ashevillena]
MHAHLESLRPVMDLDVERQLRHRMAMTSPLDTAHGMFFSGVLEVVRTLGGSEAADRCQEVSEVRRFIAPVHYPVLSLLRMMLVAVRDLGPRAGGGSAVLRLMGRRAAQDFLRSAAGRTMLVLSEGSARRLLNQLPSSYRAVVSYGERRMIWFQGEHSGRLVTQGDFMPTAYTKGLLQGVLEAVEARNISVSGSPLGLLDSEYELAWD